MSRAFLPDYKPSQAEIVAICSFIKRVSFHDHTFSHANNGIDETFPRYSVARLTLFCCWWSLRHLWQVLILCKNVWCGSNDGQGGLTGSASSIIYLDSVRGHLSHISSTSYSRVPWAIKTLTKKMMPLICSKNTISFPSVIILTPAGFIAIFNTYYWRNPKPEDP